MKKRSLAFKLAAAGCALAMTVPTMVRAEVSDADFTALKESVKKMGDELQKLQAAHSVDAQTHQKDTEEIQKLRQQLVDHEKDTQEIEKRAEYHIAGQTPPTYLVPTDGATVNHNFSILGDAEIQYAKTGAGHGAFLFADFAPIFLYRGGDNILFEAGFDFGLQNNAPASSGSTSTLNLSFAQLDYVMNDYMTLAAGNILLPLGVYVQRGAGWLNKLPDDPMSRDLVPGSGIGAQILGAVPIGDYGQTLNYAVYGVNGPSSADGSGAAASLDLGGNVGLRSDNAVANLHGRPSGGARIAYFVPFAPHYDVEVGISGQSGVWDDAGNHLWSAGVLDANVHIGPYIDFRGEYIRTRYGSDDAGNVNPQGWWVQAGYKLAGLNLDFPIINNVEMIGRFDRISDGLGTRTHRYSLGYVYYITNTLLFEGDYEFIRSTDSTQSSDQFILQLSYGF